MDADDDQQPPAIEDRTDTGGAWSAAGPLIALALIGLMLVHSCMPARSAEPARTTALHVD